MQMPSDVAGLVAWMPAGKSVVRPLLKYHDTPERVKAGACVRFALVQYVGYWSAIKIKVYIPNTYSKLLPTLFVPCILK